MKPWLDTFEQAWKNPPAFRREAMDHFVKTGFPSVQDEKWRFTDVTPVAKTAFKLPNGPADAAPLAALARGPLRASQIAFIDGRFAPEFTTLAAGRLTQFTPADGNAFAALNTAFTADGSNVHVPRGVDLKDPVHVLFLSSHRPEPFMTFPRVRIVLEENAKASVVESYLGPAGGVYLTSAVTDIELGDHAALDWYKVQRESPDGFHVSSISVRQARGSVFTSHSIALGARLSRTEIATVLDGEGAEATLNGLYEATGSQLVDHHTSIDHAKPHTTSRELYKGIMSGKSRGVFDGRIVVRPDAQKTNAIQTNKNLLLSKDALVHTKPQLEIFANDVKCKHGATIGQLDDDVLFYLRSRGIGFEEARRLMVHAFASEIVDQVQLEAIRVQLGGCLGMLVKG